MEVTKPTIVLSVELEGSTEYYKNTERGRQTEPSGGRGRRLTEGRRFSIREGTVQDDWRYGRGSQLGAPTSWSRVPGIG